MGNYWVRAEPNFGRTGFNGGVNSAILRYVGAPIAEPTTPERKSTRPLLETNLHPSENPGAVGLCHNCILAGTQHISFFQVGLPFPGGVDFALNLKFAFVCTSFLLELSPSLISFKSSGDFMINGASFTSPNVPVLLQILSGAKTANELLPLGSVIPLPGNSTIEISMPGNIREGPHPFHLHGVSIARLSIIRSLTHHAFSTPLTSFVAQAVMSITMSTLLVAMSSPLGAPTIMSQLGLW